MAIIKACIYAAESTEYKGCKLMKMAKAIVRMWLIGKWMLLYLKIFNGF